MQRKKEYIDSRIDEANIDTGIIVLLTGNGKGKSSSAMGMICRALGYDMKVGLVRFLKGEQLTGGDLFLDNERQFSEFNYIGTSHEILFSNFNDYEISCEKLLDRNLTLPAYEFCIKASHAFNLLDARGLISVSERQVYILRVRNLAKKCCESWLENNND